MGGTMKTQSSVKIVISVIFIGLAIIRLVFYDFAVEHMDAIFLGLIIAAILVHIIPMENIKSFKAAGIELTLDQSTVKTAIDNLGLERIQDKKLKKQFVFLENELTIARGGRVLWIDDKPQRIIGERKLLRALGIDIVTAISSPLAEDILTNDNDFDLIISDVQRLGDSYIYNNGVDIHEGVNFIVKIRNNFDQTIKDIPVVFYAAYDWNRLVEFTKSARETRPEPEISNSVIDFIPKVIKQLAISRSTTILYNKTKAPTSIMN
jgi:CheY-like chemotaxis protein